MFENFLGLVFVIGLVIAMFIRSYYRRIYRQNTIAEARKEGALIWVFMVGWGVGLMLPLFVFYGQLLDFASYTLPLWLQWVGAAIFLLGDWFLWRSHADLGHNFSHTLELREGHDLVTEGVYKRIRHPMYSAHFVIAIGIALMVPNWLAGLMPLVSIIFTYLLRVGGEENMMMDKYGEDYQSYIRQTGRLWPKM